MITQELFQSMMQDRMVEGARLRTERQAKALMEERPSARRGQSRRSARLPLPSFVVDAVWGMQVS